jgi:hypothetical protein
MSSLQGEIVIKDDKPNTVFLYNCTHHRTHAQFATVILAISPKKMHSKNSTVSTKFKQRRTVAIELHSQKEVTDLLKRPNRPDGDYVMYLSDQLPIKRYTITLNLLPDNTTEYSLYRKLKGAGLNPIYCYIPKKTETSIRLPVAYVHFQSEADLMKAKSTFIIFDGQLALWLSTDHHMCFHCHTITDNHTRECPQKTQSPSKKAKLYHDKYK